MPRLTDAQGRPRTTFYLSFLTAKAGGYEAACEDYNGTLTVRASSGSNRRTFTERSDDPLGPSAFMQARGWLRAAIEQNESRRVAYAAQVAREQAMDAASARADSVYVGRATRAVASPEDYLGSIGRIGGQASAYSYAEFGPDPIDRVPQNVDRERPPNTFAYTLGAVCYCSHTYGAHSNGTSGPCHGSGCVCTGFVFHPDTTPSEQDLWTAPLASASAASVRRQMESMRALNNVLTGLVPPVVVATTAGPPSPYPVSDRPFSADEIAEVGSVLAEYDRRHPVERD